ncbi:SDR family NAD(P)-dependent oxidoreductase [Vibrio rotiferianus]|uniref:SDR family NAD(P)-dependent oxidoreductase n=1 Tax=Vibrio rotiferianus TaxID=190895 RepID=A0A7Y3ZDW9_9VIBR|nr:SDR family NAD(P)-dependent oxidoreductase [Vibrio rotiferianus]NOH51157.1 SDR family NAD(P)-dependent oxidoreductase [Vibrio rotiferianus]
MKLVIVTGGSKGLGKSIVEQYTKNSDWCVYEISRTGRFPLSFNCDLSDINALENVCNEIFSLVKTESWNEVVLINNAGELKPITSTSNLKTSDIAMSITINQISAFILISRFISTFRESDFRKTIVNISSGAATKGYAGWSLYCASKAACENFINAINIEEATAPNPFTAINYDPFVMDTSMQATIRESNKADFPALERFIGFKVNQSLLETTVVARDLIEKIEAGLLSGKRYSVT